MPHYWRRSGLLLSHSGVSVLYYHHAAVCLFMRSGEIGTGSPALFNSCTWNPTVDIMLFITLFLGLFIIHYFYMRFKFSYFRRRGIPEDPGYFPLGNKTTWKMFSGQLAFTCLTQKIYEDYPNEKFIGTYGPFGQRIIVVRDLELAKLILIKHFDHFVDRRPAIISRKANKYFADILVILTGDKWRTMRSILSPIFTSGKLKSMIGPIHKVGDEFVNYVREHPGETNMKVLTTSCMLDMIAAVGLGIESNSFKNPDSDLRRSVAAFVGENGRSTFRVIKVLFINLLPRLAKALDVSFIDPAATNFIVEVIKSTLKYRETQKMRKNDLIDTLLDALKNYNESNSAGKAFTPEEIEDALVSNALVLLLAGFDTSSNGMSICAYFLATHPDIQERLLREIQDAIAESDDEKEQLDYRTIQEMPFLDAVVHEALRLYPLTLLERQCVRDYHIEGTDVTIPKGTLVQIASPQIMKDEQFYRDPHVFNPDRFMGEEKSSLNPYAYMAFGQGPRNCIGMRLALLFLKVILVRMLVNFKLSPCTKTASSLIPDPFSPSLMPKGGIWLDIQPR